MTRGRWLYKLAVFLLAATGMMSAAIPRASAATGAGGLTILYASLQNQAHQCNVIADDGTDQAVVCSDIVTYEGATDYYAYGRAEMLCQTSAQPHTTIPCYKITAGDTLEAGDGTHTDQYSFTCAGNCSSGRNYLSTRNWVYKISNAGNGTCSANAGSSYDLWNVVWGINTEIWLPDTKEGYELRFGGPNDAPNESSGHYFICP
jgi:hypothetical protein